MRMPITLLFLALLAGCTKPASNSSPTDRNAAAGSADQPSRTGASARVSAIATSPSDTAAASKGRGEVTAVDAAAGTITIAHGPIEALKWPEMTMPFQAAPEQIAGVETGDTVDFEFRQVDGRARLVSVRQVQ